LELQCPKTKYDNPNDTENIKSGFHSRFLCLLRLVLRFLYPYSYSPNLSFEIGIYRSRDWCSYRNLNCLFIDPQTFCRKSPSKNPRKKVYDCWHPSLYFHFHRLSLFPSLLAFLNCEGSSWNRIRILSNGRIHINRQY
jgi:hypothetical protein